MEYSIVIPTYNEADKITSTLTKILGFMREYSKEFEVIVSDDGSVDDTAKLVDEYAQENPEVRLLKNEHKGKGPAVISGFRAAKGDYINQCDADLATPITELKRQMVWIREQGFDIVIASREGKGAQRVGEPFHRHLMGRVFNLWMQIVVLPGIRDSQCGFKTFRASVAKDIFSRLKLYGSDSKVLSQPSFGAFEVEVLFIARKLKYRIKELPITWTYVKTPRLNAFYNSINMALDVIKIRLNHLKGLYKISERTMK